MGSPSWFSMTLTIHWWLNDQKPIWYQETVLWEAGFWPHQLANLETVSFFQVFMSMLPLSFRLCITAISQNILRRNKSRQNLGTSTFLAIPLNLSSNLWQFRTPKKDWYWPSRRTTHWIIDCLWLISRMKIGSPTPTTFHVKRITAWAFPWKLMSRWRQSQMPGKNSLSSTNQRKYSRSSL